jgi:hypothetical protein
LTSREAKPGILRRGHFAPPGCGCKDFYPQIEVISDFRLPIADFSIEIATGEMRKIGNRQSEIGNDLNLCNLRNMSIISSVARVR